MEESLRVGFVIGVTPDKWARAWRERGGRIELVPLDEAAAEAALRTGDVDMALLRLPVARDGLHVVRLYDEVPVVVVGRGHPVAAYDEIDLADLGDEQWVLGVPDGLDPTSEQLAFPPMTPDEAVEVAASGTGIVLLPMSVARLLHRKDATYRPVVGVAPSTVALVWRTDRDDEDTQGFVGVTRGRTARSSRG